MVDVMVVLACGLVRVYPCCTEFPRLLAERDHLVNDQEVQVGNWRIW